MSAQTKCTPQKKARVLGKFGGHCAYCGCKPEHLTFDHFKSVAQGGKNAVKNLMPACEDCNQAKGNMKLGRFRQTIQHRLGREFRYNRHWEAILPRFQTYDQVVFFFERYDPREANQA
jgi:5-methylcytosine-specific restriction endonuclease McrA